MKMLQITKWLNPDEEMWYKGTLITNLEWLMIEKQRLSKLTGKRVTIQTSPDGGKAIFREKLK